MTGTVLPVRAAASAVAPWHGSGEHNLPDRFEAHGVVPRAVVSRGHTATYRERNKSATGESWRIAGVPNCDLSRAIAHRKGMATRLMQVGIVLVDQFGP